MIADINKLIESKEISVSEIADNSVKRIQSSKINSFISCDYDSIKRQARRIDDKFLKRGKKHILAGIPMSVKDNISVKGYKMTCASKMLDNYYPQYTATAVDALINSDVLLLGKNNMDEFAMGSTGENSYYGAVLNPLDNSRVAGGSSGGCAAAVAAGISVYAIGSDTGGSVRLPASYCGCVGFKPTYGAISRYGLTAYASSFDHLGIIAHSVSDTEAIFNTLAFADSKDMTSHSIYSDIPTPKNNLNGIKFGIDCNYINAADNDIKKIIYASIDNIIKLGAEITEIKLPPCEDILASYYIIACAEAASNLSRYDGTRYGYRADKYHSFDDMVIKSRSEGFGDEVKKRIILGNLVLSSGYKDSYYANAVNCRRAVIKKIQEFYNEVDIIITPTSPKKVPYINALKPSMDEMYRMDMYNVLANLCYLPAISLPCGYDSDNMPVGLQLMSDKDKDIFLLSVSDIIESNFDLGGGKYER